MSFNLPFLNNESLSLKFEGKQNSTFRVFPISLKKVQWHWIFECLFIQLNSLLLLFYFDFKGSIIYKVWKLFQWRQRFVKGG
jgi:hypothetical protein